MVESGTEAQPSSTTPLDADDACLAEGSGEGCSVGLLQMRGDARRSEARAWDADEMNVTSGGKLQPPCCMFRKSCIGDDWCNANSEHCLGPCNDKKDKAWGSPGTSGVVGKDQACGRNPNGFTYPNCMPPLVCTAPPGIGGTKKCKPATPAPTPAPMSGCWQSNGAVCQYVYGATHGCYSSARACVDHEHKPPLCWEYNGWGCFMVNGDNPANCIYGGKPECEAAN
jgi:hypothetical protein